VRCAVGGEGKPQRLLGAGLSDRAGDGDHLRLGAAHARQGQRTQRVEYILDEQQRRIAKRLAAERATTASPAPAFSAPLDNSWPSQIIALDGEDRRRLWQRAAVAWKYRRSRPAGRPDFSAAMAAAMASTVHSALMPPPRAAAAATASWSENGKILPPTIWPVSWPLPAISSTSPDLSSAIASGSLARDRRSRSRGRGGQDGGADRRRRSRCADYRR